MSYILDALRKAETGRGIAPFSGGAARWPLHADVCARTGGSGWRSKAALGGASAVAFAAGAWITAAAVEHLATPAQAKMHMTFAAGSEWAAVNGTEGPQGRKMVRVGEEESPARKSHIEEEKGAGPRDVKAEVSSRVTAGPQIHNNEMKPRGTEPPARIKRAAPAPVFALEGVLFHEDAARRGAIVRIADGSTAFAKVGDRVNGYTVERIDASRVIFSAQNGGSPLELSLE